MNFNRRHFYNVVVLLAAAIVLSNCGVENDYFNYYFGNTEGLDIAEPNSESSTTALEFPIAVTVNIPAVESTTVPTIEPTPVPCEYNSKNGFKHDNKSCNNPRQRHRE